MAQPQKYYFVALLELRVHSAIKVEYLDITLRHRKLFLKYTIDEYDHFLCFLAAESNSDIRFPPSRLDFAVHEVTIFRKQ